MDTRSLEVDGLRIEVEHRGHDIVDDVSFGISAGEVLGLVGESGSGKTTVGLALLGHTRRGARIAAGEVRVDGRNILTYSASQLRSLRGRTVSYVPQDPGSALNPAIRVGTQLLETLEAHGFGASNEERTTRLGEMLEEVLLPSHPTFLRRYPHQLSGGQQQRVGLAMAFACRPRVIVLDEPTTGLDVTTQAHVLQTVRALCTNHGVSALYVSHDLAVVASLADRVAVMYGGRLVELGPGRTLFTEAAHPYTRRLIDAIPELSGVHAVEGIPGTAPRPGQRPAGCFFAPRCAFAVKTCTEAFPPVSTVTASHEVRCYRFEDVLAEARLGRRAAAARVPAEAPVPLLDVRGVSAWHGGEQFVFDVDVTVRPRQCVALVGESGSGKTTLARCVAGLHRRFSGEIVLRGTELPRGARDRSREMRREIQYIFQSPYSSLNPRKTVGQIVAQPLRIFFAPDRQESHRRVIEALERVAISASVIDRYPHELSGGERQRVAIARALVAEPSVLVCDEITSALDVSVQAAIVELIEELRRELDVGLLFVTHNLALISTIADEVAVMSRGSIVERGPTRHVIDHPAEEYTQQLLRDTPTVEAAIA
jgi:peptide/nickel transport system ATP-binding protein